MRERFSEINITGTGNPIPVGAEAKNITLNDGSILEEALGDINFQENGSIIEQINKVDNRIQRDASYAPLTAPRLKDALSVRRYNKDNILASIPVVGETKRGIAAIYNNNLYQWKISGVITSGNNTTLLLYGGDDYSTQLATTSDFLVTIKTNLNGALSGTAQNPITSLRFDLHNSTSGQNTSIYVYSEDETKNFTIPANTFLYRICLNIHSGNEDFAIENGTLKFELKDLNDQEQDTYNVVFDVQQNLNDKSWTTTVAENFVVSKGLQSEGRSTLGTIYDSKWEGSLDIAGLIDVKESASKNTGIIIRNSPICFTMDSVNNYSGSTIAEKAINQRQKMLDLKGRTTPYYIAPMYTEAGLGMLRYGASQAHDFYVGPQNSIGNAQVCITQGTTAIRNTLDLGNNRIKSTRVIQYFDPESFADIESMLTNDAYPTWTPMVLFSSAKLGAWLAWRNVGTNAALGICWKWIYNGEYAFCGYCVAAQSDSAGFVANPGLFKFRYSFYPNQSNKKRKFLSYKVINANPATINTNVFVRVGGSINGNGTNVQYQARGMWSGYSAGTSITQ